MIYSLQINILNQPREGKKLLVLDIDYTLFDHRSVAETGNELMRPYLHEFLTDAYHVWNRSTFIYASILGLFVNNWLRYPEL